jgi:signal transduction histidine kinase
MPVAVIEVEDDGPGIPPEVQARLFEPFFSTKPHGSGLGLPISARIIEHHGGALDFNTSPGEGTTFRIVLPACETDD